jgi:hypothetical protein
MFDVMRNTHHISLHFTCCAFAHIPTNIWPCQGYAKVIGFEKMEVGELSAWSDLVIFCLLSVQGYVRLPIHPLPAPRC